MTVLKIGLVVAAALFLGFAFFKLFQFIVRAWRQIEKDEEELRRQGFPRAVNTGEGN
jgi:hypothetical protein